MTCSSPSRELITFWLAGSLSPDEAALVERHVASCADCREAVGAGRGVVGVFQGLHPSGDKMVAAGAGEWQPPHLLACSRCREEVALLRSINADLNRTGRTGDRFGL